MNHRGLVAALILAGCGVDGALLRGPDGGRAREAPPHADGAEVPDEIGVTVTLDGAPAAGALVTQPGTDHAALTGDDGVARLPVDRSVVPLGVMASHPAARIAGDELWGDAAAETTALSYALVSIAPRDNPAYLFQDPGTPERDATTVYCAHCHVTLVADQVQSAHDRSARNPRLHDLFAGAASGFTDAGACAAAGGAWALATPPGGGDPVGQCFLGAGVLTDLNPTCEAPCEDPVDQTGGCADCHAPAIDGRLGGRDLREAEGIAFAHGVHCDLCHKVESIDLSSAEPGVAGRLRVLRPAEESPSPSFGAFAPLTFGPYPDVSNPRMGAAARDHFAEPELCAGCHEHDQPALVPGAALDPARWPDGRLPVQSTYSELRDGPLGLDVPCQACHMPPAPLVGNSADLDNVFDIDPGIAGGWLRPPGAVRHHSWPGPTSPGDPLSGLAATLELQLAEVDGQLEVRAVVRNVGPGHALPTGEPLRQLILVVEARCGGAPLPAVGGHVVPRLGGALDLLGEGDDPRAWPDARPGDRLRWVGPTGAWVDYPAVGPFADFSPAEKGLAEEVLLAELEVVSVAGGLVTEPPLDAVWPPGTRLGPGEWVARMEPHGPVIGAAEAGMAWAGQPGFAFARVTEGVDGALGVPHFLAVDLAWDNRLPPQGAVQTVHRFAGGCADPEVEGAVLWRRAPWALAQERGWGAHDRLLAAELR